MSDASKLQGGNTVSFTCPLAIQSAPIVLNSPFVACGTFSDLGGDPNAKVQWRFVATDPWQDATTDVAKGTWIASVTAANLVGPYALNARLWSGGQAIATNQVSVQFGLAELPPGFNPLPPPSPTSPSDKIPPWKPTGSYATPSSMWPPYYDGEPWQLAVILTSGPGSSDPSEYKQLTYNSDGQGNTDKLTVTTSPTQWTAVWDLVADGLRGRQWVLIAQLTYGTRIASLASVVVQL